MKTCPECKKKVPSQYWDAHQQYHKEKKFREVVAKQPVASKSVVRRLHEQILGK